MRASWMLAVLLACLAGRAAIAAGAGTEWTPAKVAEATRLSKLVFFQESSGAAIPRASRGT